MELSLLSSLHATAIDVGKVELDVGVKRNIDTKPRDRPDIEPLVINHIFSYCYLFGMAEESLAPIKRINDGDDLNFFLAFTAYRDIKIWLLQLNRALFPNKDEHGNISVCTLDSPPSYSPIISSLNALVGDFEKLLAQAPPDTGPRRFGNVAFREWHRLAEEKTDTLLEKHVGSSLKQHADDPAVLAELKAYLLGSFGSALRLDYGTGHELSFLAFLACLSKISAFAPGEERAIVIGVVQPYVRHLTSRRDNELITCTVTSSLSANSFSHTPWNPLDPTAYGAWTTTPLLLISSAQHSSVHPSRRLLRQHHSKAL